MAIKFAEVSVDEARRVAAKRGPRDTEFTETLQEFFAADIPAAEIDMEDVPEGREGKRRTPQSVAQSFNNAVKSHNENKNEDEEVLAVKAVTRRDKEDKELFHVFLINLNHDVDAESDQPVDADGAGEAAA